MALIKMRSTFICFILFSYCSIGFGGKIIYPWNATTAIVKAGDNFDIWFDADPEQAVKSVTLNGPFSKVSMSAFKIQTGSWIYDTISGNSYNTRITVSVPKEIPADRYDLILNTSEGNAVSLKSVKVIKKFETDYTIMHFSDTHMCQGTKINGHPERLFKISTLADISNIIGTEIVFVTGDLINNNMFPPLERAEFFYNGYPPAGLKGMHGFNAATFSIAGNHDFLEGQQPGTGLYAEKARLWNECHGLHFHHFEYGSTRYMVVNNGWNGFDWNHQLTDHATWLNKVGQGALRIAAYHKSELGIMGAWANNIDLGLSLIGHNHHLAYANPYDLGGRKIMYYADSIREHFCFNLFRIHSDGSFSVENNQDFVENPNDSRSLWKSKLLLEYIKPNNGTAKSNTAILINKFNFRFPDAQARFIMSKGAKYSVSEGTITQAFDGNTVHVVDVSVPVGPNCAISIKIKELESDSDKENIATTK